MGIELTLTESSALYGLFAESATDIILKTDRDGYVRHASPAIERLGFPLAEMLIGPHLLDLVDPASAPAVKEAHELAVAGHRGGQWVEFRAASKLGPTGWFAMRLRSLEDAEGCIYGALCAMRSIEEVGELRERLFAAEMTDPLTGLTNRQAFVAMLEHLVGRQIEGSLALFDIDYLRAINLRHGHSVGDEVLVLFSDFLRRSMRSQDIISRVGGESFSVLLPGVDCDQAEAVCRRVVETLEEIGQALGKGSLSFTASAGLSSIGPSLDVTIRHAELALLFAKTRGGSGVETAAALPGHLR